MTLNKKLITRKRVWFIAGALAFVLFMTYDIIITNSLAYQLCHAEPNPKTYINKTVEFPDSIYWEDNIYPGYDEKDRLLMVRNYLDGVHLRTMALNAPDGTVYWYVATENDWQTSRDIKAKKIAGNYFDTLDEEAKSIAQRATIYTKQSMPLLNYNVIFNPIVLSDFQKKYLWSDEIKIVDNSDGEIIAFNRRLMRRWYRILPDIGLGNRYYYPEPMCGENNLEWFDEKVIVQFSRMLLPSKHKEFIDNMLFHKESLK